MTLQFIRSRSIHNIFLVRILVAPLCALASVIDTASAAPQTYLIDGVQNADTQSPGACGAPRPAGGDKINVYRPDRATFHVDSDGDNDWDVRSDRSFHFGAAHDIPIMGDWNGDGEDEVGVYRPSHSTFFLDLDGDNAWDPRRDRGFHFGARNDLPLVGDWDGDGLDEVGVYRPSRSTFFLDLDGDDQWDSRRDRGFHFGARNDLPLVGDWDGDGLEEVGVYRPAQAAFYMDLDGDGAWTEARDRAFKFGAIDDTPIAGDWNNDGVDEIGVHRSSDAAVYLDIDGNNAWDANRDRSLKLDASEDLPIAGDWTKHQVAKQELLLWRDCGTGSWHLRATGTGERSRYVGSILADQRLSGVRPVSLESNDQLDTSSMRIDFDLSVVGKADGFDFTLPSGAQLRLELDTPIAVLLGRDRTRLNEVDGIIALPDVDTQPVAKLDRGTVEQGRSITIDVLGNDEGLLNQPVTVSLAGAASGGTAVVTPDNRIRFTAAPGTQGPTSITYRVTDVDGDSAIGSALVNVTCGACISDRKIVLRWNPHTEPVTGYWVVYGPGPESTLIRIANLFVNNRDIDPRSPSISFSVAGDLGAKAGDNVCFKVGAFNNEEQSRLSEAVCTTI